MASQVDIVISAATQQAGAAIEQFGAKFAAALGVERIVRWMVATSEVIERTSRLAEGVGMAVEAFSGLQAGAKLSDVDVGELSQGLRVFNNAIAEASKSGSQAGAIFRAMGIDIQGKNTAQVLNEVADAFQSYENGAKKSALAQQLFGRGSMEMISWLNKGSAGMAESAALATALGATLDHDTVKGAEDVSEAMKKVSLAFSGAGNELVKTFGPTLAYITNLFTAMTMAVNTAAQMVWAGFFLMGSAAKDVLHGDLSAVKDDWKIFTASIDQELEAGKNKLDAVFKPKAAGVAGTKTAPSMGLATGDQLALGKVNQDIFTLKTSIELSQENMVAAKDDYDRELISAEQYYARISSALKEQLRDELAILSIKRDYVDNALREELKNKGDSTAQTAKEIELLQKRNELILDEQKLVGDFNKKQRTNLQSAEDSTFGGGLRSGLKDLDSYGTHAKAAAMIVKNTLGTAIQGLSTGIMGLIKGTTTWGKVMMSIGDMVLENIIQMVLEYTVFHQLRMLFDTMFHGVARANIITTTAVGNTAAASNAGVVTAANVAIAASAAPAAVATTGASWGGNWIVGLVIGIAAIAALMAAFGAFESGGLVAGGEQFIRVNERGPEFVLPAEATARLKQYLPSLQAGVLPVSGSGARSAAGTSSASSMQSGRSSSAGPVNVSFGQLNDRNAMRAFMAGEGTKIVISQMNRRSNKISL